MKCAIFLFASVVIAALFAALFKLIFTFNYGIIIKSSLDLWICSFKMKRFTTFPFNRAFVFHLNILKPILICVYEA